MNFHVVFLFFYVVSSNEAIEDDREDLQWIQYEKEFGKSYRSPVERRKRYSIFMENLNKIKTNNALFEEGKSGHEEGINQFTDWSSEEFLNFVNRGWTIGPKISSDVFQMIIAFKLPQNVDWRNKSVVTSVKNQGSCSSSWSFSAAAAIEGQLGLKGNLVSLSEQNLIDCGSNTGCNRGSTNEAFDYVRQKGIQSEVSYPYIGAEGSCSAEPSKVVTRISNFVKIPAGDEGALQQAIASVGPISVAIVATESLQRYKSGVLSDGNCKNGSQNHAVLVVGYGSENGKDFYLIKNSWGDKWGEKGYFRLARNKSNMCQVASAASYPVL